MPVMSPLRLTPLASLPEPRSRGARWRDRLVVALCGLLVLASAVLSLM